MAVNPSDEMVTNRIWSEPLTDNERHLAMIAFSREPDAAPKWGNFILRVLDGREACIAELEAALRDAVEVIDGLSDQQAMADDWYVEKRNQFAALAGGAEGDTP